ncbi:hypothetical protein BH23BAC1_BH23BAC1_38750 [soil metagenome]
MKALVFLIACLLLTATWCRSQQHEFSFKENYNVTLPAQLRVNTDDGNIEVTASEGNIMEVFYMVQKKNETLKITREELEQELDFEVVQKDNGLDIKIKNKKYDNYLNSNNRIYVNLRISVPKETATDLNTSDGNISLTGLNSDQKCKTSDGNLHLSNITGNIKGTTSDGNIQVNEVFGNLEVKTSDGNIKMNDITGNVQSTTSDGNIELNQITGDVTANTSDGDILFNELIGSISGKTSDGNIRGGISELKNKLSLKTSDGNINVNIPDQQGLDLNIRGESLNVPLNNFSGKSDKKFISGKINGGGTSVDLTASDGSVTLNYNQ